MTQETGGMTDQTTPKPCWRCGFEAAAHAASARTKTSPAPTAVEAVMADPTLPETPTDEAIEAMAEAAWDACLIARRAWVALTPRQRAAARREQVAAYAALRRHLEQSNG